MLLNNKAYIFVRNYKTKDDKYPLYLRVCFDSNKKDFSLKLKISDPSKFDAKKNQIKGGADVARTNIQIQQFLQRANKILEDANMKGEKLTALKFEKLFSNSEDGNSDSFIKFAEAELILLRGQVRDSYYTHVKSAVSKLKLFRKEVMFCDINYDFITKFERFLIVDQQNNLNTVTSTLKRLKTLLIVAQKKDKISKNPFAEYKMKSEPTNRTFLTLDELKKLNELYDKKILPPYLQNVLKYFIFSCYVGLRYADIRDLTYDQIEKESNDYFVILDQQKTRERVYIPLKNRAKELIDDIEKGKGKVFRVNTNQVTNRFIKEIMTILEINKEVSFHCARHTFATVALSLGIDLKTVSSLMGHTDIKATQIYAKVLLSSKSTAMDKFNAL